MRDFATKVMTAMAGKTHLFSTGQAGFIIKSSQGQLLAIDLYLSDCVERVEGHEGFKRLLPHILGFDEIVFDVIICTHPHLDHFDIDAVPVMIANKRSKLLCSTNCKTLIDVNQLNYYSDQIIYVKPGDQITVGDFEILFTDCDHGAAAPDAVGVVVKVDGKVFYEAGDTCLRLDRVDDVPKPIDVMIAPINGAYGNLNEEECCLLATAINPKLIVPCHYGMFASHHGDIGYFYDIIKEKGQPFLIMQQGEHLEL